MVLCAVHRPANYKTHLPHPTPSTLPIHRFVDPIRCYGVINWLLLGNNPTDLQLLCYHGKDYLTEGTILEATWTQETGIHPRHIHPRTRDRFTMRTPEAFPLTV